MPFKITKNKDGSGTFKVVAKANSNKVYAYATKNPRALIQAIEAQKARAKTRDKKKTTNVKSTKTTYRERKK
jgi:hypothetical protein